MVYPGEEMIPVYTIVHEGVIKGGVSGSATRHTHTQRAHNTHVETTNVPANLDQSTLAYLLKGEFTAITVL